MLLEFLKINKIHTIQYMISNGDEFWNSIKPKIKNMNIYIKLID